MYQCVKKAGHVHGVYGFNHGFKGFLLFGLISFNEIFKSLLHHDTVLNQNH